MLLRPAYSVYSSLRTLLGYQLIPAVPRAAYSGLSVDMDNTGEGHGAA
jgi:hypothetical protein